MPMIQGIDAGALINAFRQGRQDRFDDQERAFKLQQAQAGAEKQRRIAGLLGALAGGQSGGISGAYSTPPIAPGPNRSLPSGSPAPKPPFDQAFSPDAMSSIASGATPPVAAPAPQPAPQAPPRAAYNPDLMRQLMFLDPETGQKLASGLKAMSETELAQRQAQNDASGLAAHYIAQGKSPEERQARFQHVAPMLQQNGVPPEGIQRLGSDLSDTALNAYQGMAVDFDKLMDNERADREQNMGKVITPQPGAGAFVRKPDGTIETIVAPNDGTHATGAPVGGNSLPAPKSKAERDALPPGTRYVAPDGSIRTIPGGGASNGTGGF